MGHGAVGSGAGARHGLPGVAPRLSAAAGRAQGNRSRTGRAVWAEGFGASDDRPVPDCTTPVLVLNRCRLQVRQARRRGRLLACTAAVLASAAAGQAPVEPRPAQPLLPSAEQFGDEVLRLINQLRQPLGLPLLHPDPALARIAAARSQEMALAGRLSHTGFTAAFQASGRQACVENLAFGYRQPAALVAAWQASSSHQRNLVAPGLHQAGVVLQAGYATLFACR